MKSNDLPNHIDIDEKKINKIIIEHEYVIKIIIAKYRILQKDVDDAMQEGRLGLLKAINAFKENKGANFNSFASLCIERQILSFLRNQNRKKNKINAYCYSYENLNPEYELKNSNKHYKSEIEEYILTKIHYNDVYSNAITRLNILEKTIFKQYIYGYTISELSEKYKIPKKQIYVIIAKAKKKINEILKKINY